MSLVSNKPALSGSQRSVRLVSWHFRAKTSYPGMPPILALLIIIYCPNIAQAETWQEFTDKAQTLSASKQYDRAEAYLNRANEIVEKVDLQKSTDTLLRLVRLYREAKWHDKEVLVCRKLVTKYSQSNGASPNQLAFYKYLLGTALNANKQYQEALTVMELAVGSLRPQFSSHNPYLASMLNELAASYRGNNLNAKAQILEREASGINSSYMAELKRRIKACWHPPKSDQSKKAIATFTLSATGNYEQLRISKSSSSQTLDDLCLRAIEMAGPITFTTPPTFKVDLDPIFIEFSFDYNVMGAARVATPNSWAMTQSIENGKVTSYSTSSSEDAIKARKILIEKEANDEAIKLKKLLEQKEQLDEQGLFLLLTASDRLRNTNQFEKLKELDHLMNSRSDCQMDGSPQNLILRSITALDTAKTGNLAEAEKTLRSVIESPGFDRINLIQIKSFLLKQFGDLLYKQNKIEQADAVYSQIKSLQRK